jgi:hypothetical protein
VSHEFKYSDFLAIALSVTIYDVSVFSDERNTDV